MKILITGVSSFTGAWFASELAQAGHQVVATTRGPITDYEGLRADRLAYAAQAGVEFVENCSFGDSTFIDALTGVDLVCHHGAEVKNYQSVDFDVIGAVASNTMNSKTVFEACAAKGVSGFVASGSVFEQSEGLGEMPLRAFSPYGLSKGLSWQIQDFWAGQYNVPIGKFIIPNPFGPLEEARFCAFLMRTWMKGDIAEVRTPSYVRDNIPIDLLAAAYTRFVDRFLLNPANSRCAPSGYIESQGRFAERFAKEIGRRLGIATPLALAEQKEFPEPIMRTNSQPVRAGWDEAAFWDRSAAYYKKLYCNG